MNLRGGNSTEATNRLMALMLQRIVESGYFRRYYVTIKKPDMTAFLVYFGYILRLIGPLSANFHIPASILCGADFRHKLQVVREMLQRHVRRNSMVHHRTVAALANQRRNL